MLAPKVNHEQCGPGCYWCALVKARAARAVEGVARQVDALAMARDLDQLCNFIGDELAGVLDNELRTKLLDLVQKWIANRAVESVIRNLQNPAYHEGYAQINHGPANR